MNDRISILIVDDEPRNLDTLESVLGGDGYELLRADDADKALRLLLEHDVAAIVLDVKMPGVSGFELARLIKGTKKFRQIPIVFLTAYLVDENDAAAGYGAGAVDYLTKPVNPTILRHKIAVFAELFRKTRALAELNEHLEARVAERTNELETSEAALREASAQKDRFLATLAHELRNPLAPLRTGIELLRREPDRSALQERVLATMSRQVDHMVRLIDDLLDVSRITRGALELRKARVDLESVIAMAIESASVDLGRRGQSVVVDAKDGAVDAVVDATRIAQIVANLLQNASKHSPRSARIDVVLRRDGDSATIEVIDEGTGIPADQLDRVFDMFVKIDRPGQAGAGGGLGIGLALSRQLADLHGGRLTASSAGEGRGATFTLSVPARVTPGAGPSAPRSEVAPVPARDERSLRVVVVEDNDDAGEMMHLLLRDLGHEAALAKTGASGVELVLRSRPDVVICDLGLPDMDGVEVCRRIHAELEAPPAMVALTGWGMQADRQRTTAAGFRRHLVKPVDVDALQRVLAEVAPRP